MVAKANKMATSRLSTELRETVRNYFLHIKVVSKSDFFLCVPLLASYISSFQLFLSGEGMVNSDIVQTNGMQISIFVFQYY